MNRQKDTQTDTQYENITFPHTRAVIMFTTLFHSFNLSTPHLLSSRNLLNMILKSNLPYTNIGGSRGHPPPPTGSISFLFTHVFAKKCTRRRSVPPQRVGAPPTGNPGSATDKHYDMNINAVIISCGPTNI